jgi:hypothetical protein
MILILCGPFLQKNFSILKPLSHQGWFYTELSSTFVYEVWLPKSYKSEIHALIKHDFLNSCRAHFRTLFT